MSASTNRTLVFVHGMFMTPLCWEEWERYFGGHGFKTLAPAWPEHDAPVEEQRRRHPSAALGALTLDRVLERYRQALLALGEKPILIGHSMGGLIVQLLLQEGLGAAGIAIDSAPPKGVISLKWSFLKSNWPSINPVAKIDEPMAMSFEAFQYAFANGLPLEVQRACYDRHFVPESRRIGKAPTTKTAAIDFTKPRPPLLLVAGGNDHIIPASLNRANFAKYKKTPAVTDFREFAGRTHFIIGQEGWQEVADAALEWLGKS
jgi:pimeloyl-ACP methyl ester carboxylesterase